MYMSIALTSSTTHSHSSSDPTQASASESLSTLRAPSLTHTSLHYRLPSTARTSLLPQHSPTNYAMLWNEGKRRILLGAPMRSEELRSNRQEDSGARAVAAAPAHSERVPLAIDLTRGGGASALQSGGASNWNVGTTTLPAIVRLNPRSADANVEHGAHPRLLVR